LSLPIEDYALIGNTRTAALAGRDGSIDWLCLPRFDSAACFASLLGDAGQGRWLIRPAEAARKVCRAYRPSTLILETEWETHSGRARVTDFMPHWEGRSDVVRLVEGLSGRVKLRTELMMRFGYGEVVPWVQAFEGGLIATAGPDSVELRTRVPLRGQDFTTKAELDVAEGQQLAFTLAYCPSHRNPPQPLAPTPPAPAPPPGGETGAGAPPATDTTRTRFSAPSSPSRHSPILSREAWSPPPPPLCPSTSALRATGTIGSAGCGTPPSPCTHCSPRVMSTRPGPGVNGCCDRHRLLGNFPQAFTHVALINSARNLSRGGGPGEHRGAGDRHAADRMDG
jgi:hypothetical protein